MDEGRPMRRSQDNRRSSDEMHRSSDVIRNSSSYIPGSRKKWFSWPRMALFLTVLGGSFMLLYFCLPVDEMVKHFVADYEREREEFVKNSNNNTDTTDTSTNSTSVDDSNSTTGIMGEGSVTISPSIKPSMPIWNFDQCERGNDGDLSSRCCNGLSTNCDLTINEALFAMLHNANHHQSPSSNHELPLEMSLLAGFRALHLNLCLCDNQLTLCNSFCNVGRRDLDEVLTSIYDFLDVNINEILIIKLELKDVFTSTANANGVDNTQGNAQNIDMFQFIDSLQEIPGMVSLLYSHNNNDNSWPTMETLLSQNKRIILFKHGGKLCANGHCPDTIHEWHHFTVESKRKLNINSIQEFNTTCKLNEDINSSQIFYEMNHFLSPNPSIDDADFLNSMDFVSQRIHACESITNLIPNFLNVDFWGRGEVLEAVHEINSQRAIQKSDNRRRLSVLSTEENSLITHIRKTSNDFKSELKHPFLRKRHYLGNVQN
mmetsp:Transcript_8005/g.11426  ORF Transcript_8005/g.11426 Transcript_8005/m.11426 type:complete len:487 (-) Transcript_8005:405-1865(-)